jgi:hypothetical protein
MAEIAAQEIGSIRDPKILHLYLTAVLYQRCKLGGGDKNCRGCLYRNYDCRALYDMLEHDSRLFEEE